MKDNFLPFRLIREKYLDKLQVYHPELMNNLAIVIIETTHRECRGVDLKKDYINNSEGSELYNEKIFEIQLEKNLGDDAKLNQWRDEVFKIGRRG